MKVYSVEQTRQLEREAVAAGVGYLELMENAGMAVFKALRGRENGVSEEYVILCGKRNNGGDGFVVANALHREKISVTVILAEGQPKTQDAGEMFCRCQASGCEILDWNQTPEKVCEKIKAADVLVDCIYGIGFHGELSPSLQELMKYCNETNAYRVAVDLPSGSECDSGNCSPNCFSAHRTYTFHTRKPVHDRAEEACGEIKILPVGVPEAVLQKIPAEYEIFSMEEIAGFFSPRPKDSNKGTFGNAMCVCGSYGMAGAAKLATRGALRCGAGLVHLLLPESIYPPVAAKLEEPVFVPLKENGRGRISAGELPRILNYLERATAILVGCGLGAEEDTGTVVRGILKDTKAPLVVDADGINLWASHINEWKVNTDRPVILTPHPGEMARLLNTTVAQVQADRMESARRFAREHGVILVLKGYHTWIAFPDGRMVLNLTGNPGMSKGGCGDLLAGMVVSLLAQGLPAERAVCAGVYLHGLAGDLCAERLSQTAMLPGDMAEVLPELFLQIEAKG